MPDMLRQEIEEALKRGVDGNTFERCACDLLRSVYPSLAPVRGGADAGRDGAIADGQGPPIPLICTTSKEHARNLRGSLKQHLKAGGTKKAVFATSRFLTPLQRRRLETAAAERGVTLVNVHDGEWFVQALYRNEVWRKELLGIAGDAPALSPFPPHGREDGGHALVGRADDLAWLQATPSDLLLVGQPGYGKTALFERLVAESGAVFAVDTDRTRLANGLRSGEPPIVLVDDAHVRQELVSMLMVLRRQVDLPFRIVASCWPGSAAAVAGNLNVPRQSRRELSPLDRDQLVEVVKSAGLGGPAGLIDLILDQALGSPGMAFMLARLCLRDEVQHVWSGDALAECFQSKGFLRDPVDRVLLACFSVAGSAGIEPSAVATVLRRDLLDIQSRLTNLAEAGVIREAGRTIVVVPEALRWVLVRDELLSRQTVIDWRQLIKAAKVPTASASVLMAAYQRGGKIHIDDLFDLADQSGSSETWRHFAMLGADAARRVIDKRPDRIIDAARGMLEHLPGQGTSAILCQIAVSRDVERCPAWDTLRVWLCEDRDSDEPVRRRRLLMEEAPRLPDTAGNNRVLAHVCALVMMPNFSSGTMAPGRGDRFVIRQGFFPQRTRVAIQGYWPIVLGLLRDGRVSFLRPLLNALEVWTFPRHHPGAEHVPDDEQAEMRVAAEGMMRDLATSGAGGAVLRQWVADTTRNAGFQIRVQTDPAYEELFGRPPRGEAWEAFQQQSQDRIRARAREWTNEGPQGVLERLRGYEDLQQASGIKPDRNFIAWLADELANVCGDPVAWGHAFLAAGRNWVEVRPFLRAAADSRAAEWERFAGACLDDNAVFDEAAIQLLHDPGLPPEMQSRSLSVLESVESFDRAFSLGHGWPRLAVSVRHILLTSSSVKVRSAAAIGEWLIAQAAPTEPELREVWREAILSADDDGGYWIARVLRQDSELAEQWARKRILGPRVSWFMNWEHVIPVLAALPLDARRRLLGSIGPQNFDDLLVEALIGDDTQLYREWVADPNLREVHLVPLQSSSKERWSARAKVALEGGYRADDLREYCLPRIRGCGAASVEYWRDMVKWFDELIVSGNADVADAARVGRREAVAELKQAEDEERHVAIHGFGRLRG